MAGLLANLGGNPLNTPVGQKIEQATDASLPSENWTLNMEICDLINETDEGPKDAVKAIRKRLQQNTGKNYTVVLYALTVLETCVKNCGRRFHLLISQKDFILDLVKLIGPKNDPPTAVQEKVLSLIQSWADAFQNNPEMQGVVQVYNDLKQKGIEFPMTDLDTMAPIHTPQRSVPPSTSPAPHHPEPSLNTTQLPVQPVNPNPMPDVLPRHAGPISLNPEQLAKLRSELDIVQGNMKVFSEFELPSRIYLGTMHMLASNISSYKLLKTTAKNFDTTNFGNSEQLLTGEFSKYERIDNSEVIEIPPGKLFVEYLPVHLKNNCPSDFCIIDKIDSSYYNSIQDLSQSDVIGASFHGPNISRSGILTWLSLSTSTCVYIFDIEHLGKAAFDEGLKDIFESEAIVKVIHDSRQVNDCIFHLFNIYLKNVFDTQVADYLINMQMCISERLFKYVNALDSCLHKYLKVPHQFLYNRNTSAVLQDEITFFKKRPISEDFTNVLIKSSIYLPLLKQKQEILLISPYEQAVERYLDSVKSASDSEVRLMQAELLESSEVPDCLLDSLRKIRFSHFKQPEDPWTKQYREGKVKLPNRPSNNNI